MDNLAFDLKPSLTKLGFMVGLFILLNAILSNYLGGVAFGLVMLACLMALYFMHDRNPVQKMAHLDEKIWVLEFKDQTKIQANFISAQAMGRCVFLKFNDIDDQNIKFCITKEQLTEQEWKKLKTLTNLI